MSLFSKIKSSGLPVKNRKDSSGKENQHDGSDEDVITNDVFAGTAQPDGGKTSDGTVVTVYDPGSEKDISITGEIITLPGGTAALSDRMRALLIASSSNEIFYSRSHQQSPEVLSEIMKIETVIGPARVKQPIDMMTLSELYRRSQQRSDGGHTSHRTNDQSKMQREFISIVANAAKRNASDIHFIVNQSRAVTRFRVDGVMTDHNELQPQYAFELLSAAYVLADVSGTSYQPRSYQGARISSLTTELPAGLQSLRLQFNPLANDGRYLIVRLLYSGSGKRLEMSDLGYSAEQIRQISTMSARPVGINVISGPTGSGKSTTLKAILEGVIDKRRGEVNTITIEDPPEYVIGAAQQMPVANAKTQAERNEAFTQAISAGLRSDPDIMMIGEIRDLASADLAIEGALSGHPIYASLHANTAMDILTRLRDMGIDDFKVFDPTIFSGLVGQRLLRQICRHCRKPIHGHEHELDDLVLERIDSMRKATPEPVLNDHPIYLAGDGCSHCTGGYKGRAVVAEVILPDDNFMSFMASNQKSAARTYWFEKMQGLDLLGAAWIRILQGAVSPIDVENSVALFAPLDAHAHALAYWTRKLGFH